MQIRPKQLFFVMLCFTAFSCNWRDSKKVTVYRGTYNMGPEVKTFKDCDNGHEFWAVDSSNNLELKYSQMNFEKPYIPVYIEVEGIKVISGAAGKSSEYDSTLIVKKVLKITKEIPLDQCN